MSHAPAPSIETSESNTDELISQFRLRYLRLQGSVQSCLLGEFGDSTVIARVGDSLDDFLRAFHQVYISESRYCKSQLTPILASISI